MAWSTGMCSPMCGPKVRRVQEGQVEGELLFIFNFLKSLICWVILTHLFVAGRRSS